MPARGGEPRRLTFLGATLAWTIGWSADSQRNLLRVERAHVVRGRDARVRDRTRGRRTSPARSRPYPRPLLRVRRAPRDRAQLRRSGALETLSRRNGGRDLGRRDRLGHVRTAAASRRQSVLADVDRRSHLLPRRPRGHRQHLFGARSTAATYGGTRTRTEYYVRFPSTDGKRIVYSAGAAIEVFDVASDAVRRVDIETHSSMPQTARRFEKSSESLEQFAPSPDGTQIALNRPRARVHDAALRGRGHPPRRRQPARVRA